MQKSVAWLTHLLQHVVLIGPAMRHLWAPWRMQYILQSAAKRKVESETANQPLNVSGADPCFICDVLAADHSLDRANYVVWRGSTSSVILNKFPYNNGHLLIVPNLHHANLTDFNDESLFEPIRMIQSCMHVMNLMMEPQGYNVGLNQGRVAGAGLPGHLHWHLVPRWLGDVNFMPTISDTRVIIDSLDSFYDRLHNEIAQYLNNFQNASSHH